MARERAAILGFCAGLGEEGLRRRPTPGHWNALEVLEHVGLVEQAVVGILLQAPSEPAPRLVRGLLPAAIRSLPPRWRLALVANRFGKAEAPRVTRPRGGHDFERLQHELESTRRATFAAIEGSEVPQLASIRRAHAVLGDMNGLEWLDFVAAHDRRHLAQIRAGLHG
jgi:hypothetical protein